MLCSDDENKQTTTHFLFLKRKLIFANHNFLNVIKLLILNVVIINKIINKLSVNLQLLI